MGITEAIGVLGVVLNQVFIWPQVWRALQTVEGLAAGSVLGALLARSIWSVYAVSLGDVALMFGNLPVALGFLVLLGLLVRASSRPPRLIAAAAAVGAAVVAVGLVGGSVLGWVAVATAAVVSLPQMARALSDPDRLAGVSVPTYVLMSAASACWLVYGLLVDEIVISAPHFLLLPTSVIVTGLAARSQRSEAIS